MKTLVINLDRSPDRLANMREQLDRAGMPFERVLAVDGANVPADVAPFFAHIQLQKRPILLPTEIGCYASHLRALRRVIEADVDAALILEDDAEIPIDLRNTLIDLRFALPRSWDFVHLCKMSPHAHRPLGELPSGHEIVRYSRLPSGAFGYLVSRRGAQKLTDARVLRFWAVDVDFRRPWLFDLDAYGTVPPIIGNLGSTSTISTAKRHSRRRGLPKPTPYSWLNLPFHSPRGMLFNLRKLGIAWWSRCLASNIMSRAKRLGA
jgi:glycosyl transferase family 25